MPLDLVIYYGHNVRKAETGVNYQTAFWHVHALNRKKLAIWDQCSSYGSELP